MQWTVQGGNHNRQINFIGAGATPLPVDSIWRVQVLGTLRCGEMRAAMLVRSAAPPSDYSTAAADDVVSSVNPFVAIRQFAAFLPGFFYICFGDVDSSEHSLAP